MCVIHIIRKIIKLILYTFTILMQCVFIKLNTRIYIITGQILELIENFPLQIISRKKTF